MTIPIRSIYVLVLALMPHLALAQENTTDSVTNGAAHPERIMPDQATQQACDKVYSDKKLDPLRGKMPTDGAGVWTDEMSKNDLKPNAEEKSALRAYLQAEIACQRLINAYIFENDEITRRTADRDAEALFTKRISPLKSGKITYAEYFRRIDQAGQKWLTKYQKEHGIDPQRYEHAIESWLAPFKSNYAANSPWWGFYSDAIATAKDVDGGKISEATGQKLIDDRRLKFNQELADSSAQKLTNLNCVINSDTMQQREFALEIDYDNKKVNGRNAEFYDNEIRWYLRTDSDGIKIFNVLNRLSGFLSFQTDQARVMGAARCTIAVKQF